MRTRLFPVIVVTSVLVGAGTADAQAPIYGLISGRCGSTLGITQVTPPSAAIPIPSCTVIDVPGATDTVPLGINDRSQIVGYFTDAAQKTHGFLRTGGQFITIDVPNADGTSAYGINSRSQIVGSYGVNGQSHGFLLEADHFTTVDPPGATSSTAYGINDLGQIVGAYTDDAPPSIRSHGYLWTHGHFTILDVPVARAVATVPRGINRIGQVVGLQDGSNFRLAADGSFAVTRTSLVVPAAHGINDLGEIVGVESTPGASLGFLTDGLTQNGTPFRRLIEFRLSEYSTSANGINNRGQVVGTFFTHMGAVPPYDDHVHGFVLTPPDVVEDVSASASPDGSRAPVVTVIVDNALDLWTLGPGEEILRNGVQAAGAYGSQILWHGGAIYVLGDDYNWWRWTGSTWSFAGAIDPAS